MKMFREFNYKLIAVRILRPLDTYLGNASDAVAQRHSHPRRRVCKNISTPLAQIQSLGMSPKGLAKATWRALCGIRYFYMFSDFFLDVHRSRG